MSVHKSLDLKGNRTLEILHDDCPESPRTSCDNLGIMAVFHDRYDFGDDVDFSADDFEGWDAMATHIQEKLHAIAILPLYMYVHSGATISTSPFSCSWDSGQIGFVYTTQKKLDLMGLTLDDGETWTEFKARLEKYLVGEVETMDTWIRGEIYGFRVKDCEGEEEDSCWGFYGDNIRENGMLDHVGEDQFLNLDDL